MIELRVYRAAFVPALLAVMLAMFSLENRPAANLRQDQILAADVLFDGELAAAAARQIDNARPERRPGSTGNRETAELVARRLESFGFRAEVDRFDDDGRDLVNVIGRRAGRSRDQIVVVAPRDADGRHDAAGSASDTAALLELARVFEGRPSRNTIVLASIDGTTAGDAGVDRLVEELVDPGQTVAVLVVSSLGAPLRSGSPLVAWSNDASRAGIGLERTVAGALRAEVDGPLPAAGALAQLVRLGFPLGVGPQGVLLERGYDSVRISGSGELPPTGRARLRVDEDRIGSLGRAVLRTVSALDQGGRPRHGPSAYVIVSGQVLPGWVLALLSLTLLLPAVVAAVDAFARANRRREPVTPWLRWVALLAVPFAAALAVSGLFALAGVSRDPLGAPVAPSQAPLDAGALAVLAVIGGVIALGLLAVRTLGRFPPPAAPGAGCAAALALAAAGVLLWLLNPYAALLMVPAMHLWMLTVLVSPAPPPRLRWALVGAGLILPLLAAVYYMLALDMDPLHGLWYLLLLVTGGAIGLPTALFGCVLLGALVAVIEIARAAPAPEPSAPSGPSVRGPSSYAGPGSLGGTDSAFRR